MTELWAALLDVVVPIALVTFLGYLAARWGWVADTRPFSRVVLNVLLPALVFISLYRAHVSNSEFFDLSLSTIVNMALVGLVSAIIIRVRALDNVSASAFMLSTLTINTGNFGLPLSQFAYGEAGLARATIFFVVSLVIMQTAGLYIASRGHADLRTALRTLLTSPLVYSAVFGLLLNRLSFEMPLFLTRALDLAGNAATPLMLIILGAQLADAQWDMNWGQVALASGIRLIAAPLLAFATLQFLPLQGLTRSVSVLQASMPTAVIAFLFASEYQTHPRFVTSVIVITTLGSFITLPILITLLR